MVSKVIPYLNQTFSDQASKEKLLLADYIMKFFTPLFDEEINRQSKQLEIVEKDYSELAGKINNIANDLKQIKFKVQLENTKKKILEYIYNLKKRDLLYGPLKTEAINFINNQENLSNEQLNEKLKYFTSLVNKTIKKVN